MLDETRTLINRFHEGMMRHMTVLRFALLGGLVLAACSGDGDGDDDPGTVDAPGAVIDAPDSGVSLALGRWRYSSYDRTSDTCGGNVDGDGEFTIDATTATSFHITRDSTPASDCAVNGSGFFTCTTPDEVQDRRPADDAVFRASLALSGHVTTTTLASGMQTIAVTCTGTDCGQFLPGGSCSVTADISVSRL